jgi:acetyl esterase/lipase
MRTARLLLLALVATALARAVATRLRALRPVAPDLRTPMMFLPLAPGSDRHLRLVRKMMKLDIPLRTRPGVTVETTTATVPGREPVRVLTFERPERPHPSAALLWMHGGGTVIGRPEQSSAICSRWADELDLLVVAVDYRLAPDHPYPSGLEDCFTALQWLSDSSADLGVDPDRIIVGGDSAGGLLAAALSMLDRDRGLNAVSFQLLEYPMLDDRTIQRTKIAPEHSFVWSPKASRFGWTSYLRTVPPGAVPPQAAPARATEMAGLPPAWIGVGDIDLLHDEAVDYATRLAAAGVPCELHIEPGMYHGADSIRPNAPTARSFTDTMTRALARAVTRNATR